MMKKLIFIVMILLMLVSCLEVDSPNISDVDDSKVIDIEESTVIDDDDLNQEVANNDQIVESDDMTISVDKKSDVTVIATCDYVIGGIVEGQWMQTNDLPAGIDASTYDVYSIRGKLTSVMGEAIVASFEPGEGISIPFDEKDRFEDVLYTSKLSETRYREVRELSVNNEVYLDIIGTILLENEITSVAEINRILKFDMEDDGVDEVLIAASNTDLSKGIAGERNEYAFVILRKIIDNDVKTFVLTKAFYTQNPDMENGVFELAYDYDVIGVLDLNGDGVLEIVIRGEYYEGEWTEVYEFKEDVPVMVISYGIGL